MTSFNLTREPWIGVEKLDGSVAELSTRDALASAHRLRGITDASPLGVAALTRHLLAVLHRSYQGPRTMQEWVGIARSGAFDPARVNAYLGSVEDRMDLFHPTHPFAQVRGLRERFSSYVAPIDELEVFRTGWGSARELFRHRPAQPAPTMTPARAARALLAHHAFAIGGLVRKPGEPTSATAAPLVRAAVVVIRGRTLFHTLVANLLRYGPDQPIPTGGAVDRCSWEQDPLPVELPLEKEPKRAPLGYLDLLTWLSRRVELIFDGEAVTGYINAVGQGLVGNAPRDPMVTYRRHNELGWLPIGIDIHRAFWRNAGALFETTRDDSSKYVRPLAIDLVADPVALEAVGDVLYDIEVLGVAAEKSRIDAIRFERVHSRGRCFNDPDAGSAVRGALEFAQRAVDALVSALYQYARVALAPAQRVPDPADVRNLVEYLGAAPAAWSAVGVVFEHFLQRLADGPGQAEEAFRRHTGQIVRDVFCLAISHADATGRWLKAGAVAERSFYSALAKIASPPEAPSPERSHLQ